MHTWRRSSRSRLSELGRVDSAGELACEALDVECPRGDDSTVAWKLNGLAAVATAHGEFERSATVIGAADPMLEAPHLASLATQRSVAEAEDALRPDTATRRTMLGSI